MDNSNLIQKDEFKPPMREVLYRKRKTNNKRHKLISLIERTADKDCTTYVRKHFVYFVDKQMTDPEPLQPPEIHIKKAFDSKKKEEAFHFRVKGVFYLTHGRHLVRVRFCHTLHISIIWKNQALFPKKSATLT